jgi:hypothetical protein
LADALSEDVLTRLRRHMPGDMGQLFTPPRAMTSTAAEPHGKHAPGPGSTLADGRPGSRHPLSEANPAHRDSVARSENPHADTKLSSSAGMTQERVSDTLATGKPGSHRPLSEG